MIEKGDTVFLQSQEAIYCTCKIVTISDKNVTITYCAGMKRDRNTGEFHMQRPVKTISKEDIVHMSKRL